MRVVDIDFARYVAVRKGATLAQLREGAAYAFSADLRLLRRLKQMGPVPAFLEETGRLFRRYFQKDLIESSVRATSENYPQVVAALSLCAERLHVTPPSVWVVSNQDIFVPTTVGSAEDAYLFLPESQLSALSEAELLFVLGAECGRIQNGHIPMLTALFDVKHAPQGLLRVVSMPVKSFLSAWLRRADITADRAGLICSRSIEASVSALKKILPSQESEEFIKRERALMRFLESQYMRRMMDAPGGESQDVCDEAVATILDEKIKTTEG